MPTVAERSGSTRCGGRIRFATEHSTGAESSSARMMDTCIASGWQMGTWYGSSWLRPLTGALSLMGRSSRPGPWHGSVLVVKDSVYCVAGRSAFLDGGLRFYRLDAHTGEMLAVCKIDETDPRSGQNIQKLQSGWCGLTMPVANPDISDERWAAHLHAQRAV